MILSIDVQYVVNSAYIAGILFESWDSEVAFAEYVSYLQKVDDYQPGHFFKRELPCLLKLIEEHNIQANTIVIDGFVYLDDLEKPGLGKHLYNTLNPKRKIIGVAKKVFSGISDKHKIYRGNSKKPLYITSTGELEDAKQKIASMAGNARIPTLLKRADQLCREEAKKQTQITLHE